VIASLDATGALADDDCYDPSLSADARYVAYSSKAQNLAANDGNGFEDVFLHAPLEPWADLGFALAGAGGAPELTGIGSLGAGSPTHLLLAAAAPGQPALLLASLGALPTPFKGGMLAAVPPFLTHLLATGPSGGILLSFAWPAGVPSGTQVTLQYALADAGAVQGVALSNASQATAP
jgi:hypothetical protein